MHIKTMKFMIESLVLEGRMQYQNDYRTLAQLHQTLDVSMAAIQEDLDNYTEEHPNNTDTQDED